MTGDNTNESDFERQPRESLHRDAERINPRDRRTEILAMVHDDTQVAQPARRRLIPLAAAASLAPIGAIIWGVSNTGGGQPVGQLVTPAAPTTSSPSSSPSSPSSSAAAGTTSQVALPAYFVGASSGKEDRFGLHREFVRTAVPVGATPPAEGPGSGRGGDERTAVHQRRALRPALVRPISQGRHHDSKPDHHHPQWLQRKWIHEGADQARRARARLDRANTWTVDLGVPSAGDYAFRMYEVSMQDGKGIVAETSKPLTVM